MFEEVEPPAPRHQFFILGFHTQPKVTGRPRSWRISLENPQTAERFGFRKLSELLAFLEAWMAERTADDDQ